MIDISVSLYSFSMKFFDQSFDLEDCVRTASELGFRGVEIVAAQMVENYPYPTQEWCAWFQGLLQKYRMEPVSYSAYIDMGQHTGRDLTEEEIIQCTLNDMMYAYRMGFPIVRTQHAISPGILEKMIPYAKKWKVWLGVELHHPHNCHVDVWKEYFDLFERVGSQHIGVIPDMGIFQKHPDAYEGFQPAALEDFELMVPHSKYMHGKFYHINGQGEDPSIPYPGIVEKLKALGFQGHIAAEYEGHFTEADVDCVEQLRRYSNMMHRLLG